ncbi:hypothetical protein WME73_45130 [Sorangium sp. So ce302]|jgi:hypothetical protein|uniref:hypothetical protein n=1 Tax=unclassified Sorangium TaxID=2621164 RepID=UPI003F6263E6
MAERDLKDLAHNLNQEQLKLYSEKLKALSEYRKAQARLNEVNLELIKAGLRVNPGSVACW